MSQVDAASAFSLSLALISVELFSAGNQALRNIIVAVAARPNIVMPILPNVFQHSWQLTIRVDTIVGRAPSSTASINWFLDSTFNRPNQAYRPVNTPSMEWRGSR
jgi:hypothetical protein